MTTNAPIRIAFSGMARGPFSERARNDRTCASLAPTSPYGLSKLSQELLSCDAISGHVQVSVARAFNHFGPGQDPAFAASGFARQIASIEAVPQFPTTMNAALLARLASLMLTFNMIGQKYNVDQMITK